MKLLVNTSSGETLCEIGHGGKLTPGGNVNILCEIIKVFESQHKIDGYEHKYALVFDFFLLINVLRPILIYEMLTSTFHIQHRQ